MARRRSKAISGSIALTYAAADFSLFSNSVREVPPCRTAFRATGRRRRVARWRDEPANWRQQLLVNKAIAAADPPLADYPCGQRSMRGLRMNTLGWFDF